MYYSVWAFPAQFRPTLLCEGLGLRLGKGNYYFNPYMAALKWLLEQLTTYPRSQAVGMTNWYLL